MFDTILDSLINKEDDIQIITEEAVIPKRCSSCKVSMICSVLPTFIALSKIKIHIGIEQCPFFTPMKKDESDKDI